MIIESRAIRPTERTVWNGKSNQRKRCYLANYLERTTGEQVDPSDPSITYAVDYIDAAYRLNPDHKNLDPCEIFETLHKETEP